MLPFMLGMVLHAAAPTLESDLELYEREALELRMRPLDAGHELRHHGLKLKLGLFAEGADDIFSRVPETLIDIRKYRAFKAGGVASLVLGFGLMTASSILIAVAAIERKPLDVPLFVSFLVVGLDLGGLGIGLLIFAPSYLQRAVATYNESVMAR
jgi:hypothetical protein